MFPSYDPTGSRIERYRGDSYAELFTVTDDNGNPVNLDDATVRFTVKEYTHQDQADAVIAKSSADTDEIEITQPAQGKFAVKFTPQEMQALSPRRYFYDAEVTLSDGSAHTVVYGALDILPDVTTS